MRASTTELYFLPVRLTVFAEMQHNEELPSFVQEHDDTSSRSRLQDLGEKSHLKDSRRLLPGLPVDLHGQGVTCRNAHAAALRQPDRTAQAHLQLAQVPASIDSHQLRRMTNVKKEQDGDMLLIYIPQ